ncbi:hypothetical protein ABW20_dc0110569 [Dactylellina cionopaga]|nr:hypothetical protein ABW20_dc0110569 [Dactylellina cionopaga]
MSATTLKITGSANSVDKEKVAQSTVVELPAELPAELFERPPERTLKRALGIYGIIVTVVGFMVIGAVFPFLFVIWFQAARVSDGLLISPFWQAIFLKKWAAPLATFCITCIQAIMAVQIGIVTCMLASLICEQGGCNPAQLAEFSILRSLGSGPYNLVLPLLKNIRRKRYHIYFSLTGIFLLVIILCQFMSTILLSDFDIKRIPGTPSNSSRKFTTGGFGALAAYHETGEHHQYDTDYQFVGVDPWVTGVQYFPRFAEYSRGPPVISENFYDTGHIYRALLPVRSSDQRSTIRNYTGPATVINSRVICVRPKLDEVKVWGNDEKVDLYSSSFVNFNLYVPSGLPAAVPEDPNVMSRAVNCSIFGAGQDLNVQRQETAVWEMSLCSPHSTIRLQDKLHFLHHAYYETTSYIMINSTGTKKNLRKLTGAKVSNSTGPWVTLKKEGVPASIELSLCYTRPDFGIAEVSVHADEDYSEPEISYDPSSDTYSLTDMRIMLGVGYGSQQAKPKERGLFDLAEPHSWNSYYNETWNPSIFVYGEVVKAMNARFDGVNGYKNARGLKIMGLNPLSQGSYRVNEIHRALFSDVITTTRNPALALQALLTSLMSVVYYDRAGQFDIAANSTAIFSTTTDIPARWRGLLIIATIIGTHFLFFFLTLGLFLKGTEASLLGNYWMAISQVVSPNTLGSIQVPVNKTDSEVEIWFREKEMSHLNIGV